jgi:hypothetical protein
MKAVYNKSIPEMTNESSKTDQLSKKLPKLSGGHAFRFRKPCCMPLLFFCLVL